MPLLSLRNAYYRGWFAARGRRNAPAPIMLEERFFIDVGFTDGEHSAGAPLDQWSKDIPPGTPANLANFMQSDEPVFTTRRAHSDHPPSAMRPARKPLVAAQSDVHAPDGESMTPAHTEVESAPARSESMQRSKATASNEEDSETEESDPADEDEPAAVVAADKSPPRMPEKKPQFNLPRRSYGGGPSVKRRSVKR
jgi:hypothetical protein